jgi:hypothetical protein
MQPRLHRSCMHEFQNRPTTGISDCPGCAGHGHPPGRTRAHSYSRRSLPGEKPHAVGVGLGSRRPSAVTVARSVVAPLEMGDGLMMVMTTAEGAARGAACHCSARCARYRFAEKEGPWEGLDGREGAWMVDLDLRPGVRAVFGNRSGRECCFRGGPPDDRPAAPRRRPPAASLSFGL